MINEIKDQHENQNGVIERGEHHGNNNELHSSESVVEHRANHHPKHVEHHESNENEERSENTMKTNLNTSLNNVLTGIAILFAIFIGLAIDTQAKSIGEKINRIENNKIIGYANDIRISEITDISQSISSESTISQNEISVNSIIESAISIENISRNDYIIIINQPLREVIRFDESIKLLIPQARDLITNEAMI